MKRKILVVAALAAGGMMAQASATSSGTPGWMYGLYNCGAAHTSSRPACTLCCNNAVLNGQLDAGDQADCQTFCNQANFSRPAIRWYHRPVIWVFGIA